MAFSKEDKALTTNLYQFKIRFTEDSDGIFEDKLQTGHFTKKDSGNMKHRPQALVRQTKAHAY